MKKHLLAAVIVAAGLLGGGAAVAQSQAKATATGAVIAPTRLAAPARAALVSEIEKARKSSPEAFRSVAEIEGNMASLDAKKRGRMAAVTPLLKSLGPAALLPMLERVAVSAAPRGDLPESAWLAWRVGLVESVGMLRDPRSAPVLTAILDSDESDPLLLRITSEALGKLGDDASAQKLIAIAKAGGVKGKAALAGMGECRRLVVAEHLASALGAAADEDARPIARSLGQVGSSWAWKTPAVAASGEEATTRAAAARALVTAFVAREGEARGAAQTALLIVDDPSTVGLLTAARAGQPPTTQTAIDRLVARLAKNPTR